MAKMKDSGVEWIGKIPDGWEILRAKNIFRQRNTKGNAVEIHLAATQDNGMYPQHLLDGVVKVKEETNLQEFRTVHKNDFVISLRSFQGGFEKSDSEGVCSPAYQVFYNTSEIDHNYFKKLFKSDGFIAKMNSLTVGIREGKNIQYCDFANSLIPLPPKGTQQIIATYLDEKCSQIEQTIQNQQQVIEKLKAYKQSLITEAVTGKVKIQNGKVAGKYKQYKESGVEWIGEIPSEWTCGKAKYYVKINNGSDPRTEEGPTPVYGSGAESFKTCVEYKEGPTVLIGRKGATLHIPHYIEGNYWNVDTAFDVKLKSSGFELKYYYYCATAFDYKFYLTSTTLPSMTQTNYGNMFIPVPDNCCQKEIIRFLDLKCIEIDSAIEQKQKLIEKLTEYKKSLIYECVTGKKEVK